MPGTHQPRPNVLLFLASIALAALVAMPGDVSAEELTDAEVFSIIQKQTNNFSRVSKLYVFPPGRNKRITFVKANNGNMYLIDTAEDRVLNLRYGLAKSDKLNRKMNAYRAEFAHVVKKTMQDAVREHDDEMRAKVVEIFKPKVDNIKTNTISDQPEPTLDSYHISYGPLKGKHRFPNDLPLTAKVNVGDNTYTFKTVLQYYSLPNMRVITR